MSLKMSRSVFTVFLEFLDISRQLVKTNPSNPRFSFQLEFAYYLFVSWAKTSPRPRTPVKRTTFARDSGSIQVQILSRFLMASDTLKFGSKSNEDNGTRCTLLAPPTASIRPGIFFCLFKLNLSIWHDANSRMYKCFTAPDYLESECKFYTTFYWSILHFTLCISVFSGRLPELHTRPVPHLWRSPLGLRHQRLQPKVQILLERGRGREGVLREGTVPVRPQAQLDLSLHG